MRGSATFDETGRYRYTLHRRWEQGGRRVCFCLLNPSTADAKVLDPTLTRCLGFARRWGFSAMEVVNIFALRSTDPRQLYRCDDPVGPSNDRAITRAAGRCETFVVGWGTHGDLHDRGAEVAQLLERSCSPMCWALTKAGHPKHPLYLKSSTPLMPFTQTAGI